MNTNEFGKTYKEIKADPVLYAAYLERKRQERKARPGYEAERKRNWRAANTDKARAIRDANHAVERAVASGRMDRPDHCQKCFKRCKPEAHHFLGYARANWRNVLWLCNGCHAKEHHPER